MAEKQKAEQASGKPSQKTAEDNEEEKVQLERVQKLLKEGGEINILDAK